MYDYENKRTQLEERIQLFALLDHTIISLRMVDVYAGVLAFMTLNACLLTGTPEGVCIYLHYVYREGSGSQYPR